MGVMSKDKVSALAEQQNTDLVVISPNGDPSVAKLLNANKYFYEQKRKAKETAKRQRENQIVIKEMQFRLGINQHDFETQMQKHNKVFGKKQ